jgi:hypothetical protein
MTKLLLILRPFVCLEMGPLLGREEGVGLPDKAPHLLLRNSARVYPHSHNVWVRALVLYGHRTRVVTLLQ